MKALIVPHYLYTHYQAFKNLADELESNNVTVKYFYIRGQEFIDNYNEKYFNFIKSEKFVLPPTLSLGLKTDFINRIIRLIKYLYNFYIIKLYLYRESPDVIILGSDTGGVYIRKIQEIVKKMNIPVVILQCVMFLPVHERKELAMNYSNLTKKILSIFGLFKVFTFAGDVPGTYLSSNYVLALGDGSKKIIQSFGKESCRIIKTGNPAYDPIKYIVKNKNSDGWIKSHLGLKLNQKFLIYFTEMVQEVYGEKYLHNLNVFLKNTLDSLPADILVIIKPHPRESANVVENIKILFSDNRYQIIYDVDNNALIKSSLFCIAHNSTVLFNAILMNKPIISINFKKSDNFYQFPKCAIVRNERAMQKWINRYFLDIKFEQEIIEKLIQWKEKNIDYSNNISSSIKATNAIISILKKTNEYC